MVYLRSGMKYNQLPAKCAERIRVQYVCLLWSRRRHNGEMRARAGGRLGDGGFAVSSGDCAAERDCSPDSNPGGSRGPRYASAETSRVLERDREAPARRFSRSEGSGGGSPAPAKLQLQPPHLPRGRYGEA